MKAFLELLMSLFGKKPQALPKDSPSPVTPQEELKPYIEETVKDKEFKKKRKIFKKIEVKDNSQRLVDELSALKSHNLPLASLIEDLNIFTNQTFDKALVITMIFRTEAEQDYLYKDSAKYQKKKFKSPHQFWHGVDIRSRTFTADEVFQIEAYLNEKWNGDNYYKWTAKNHTVGHGMHFHIQFVKK